MKQLRAWIVIANGHDMRLVKRKPNLAANEVCVEVVVNSPTPPKIIGSVTIDLPTPPPATADAVATEYPPEEWKSSLT